jgi:hypothetical protein
MILKLLFRSKSTRWLKKRAIIKSLVIILSFQEYAKPVGKRARRQTLTDVFLGSGHQP